MHAISSKWRKPKGRPSKKRAAGLANYKKSLNNSSEVSTTSEIFPETNDYGNLSLIESNQPAYTVMDTSMWSSLLSEVPCSQCENKTLDVFTHKAYGLSSQIELYCKSCHFKYGSSFSSARESTSRSFSINNKFVQAFLSIGKGYASLEMFSMMLGIHCMDSKTFSRCLDNLVLYNKDAKVELLKVSHDMIRQHC